MGCAESVPTINRQGAISELKISPLNVRWPRAREVEVLGPHSFSSLHDHERWLLVATML